MLPRLVAPANLPALETELRAMIEQAAPSTIIASLRALAHRRDMRDQLPDIRVPTLVVTGNADVISPLSRAPMLRSWLRMV